MVAEVRDSSVVQILIFASDCPHAGDSVIQENEALVCLSWIVQMSIRVGGATEVEVKEPETRSGRERQPRWLSPQLRSGKKLDDFRIHNSSDHARRVHS